MVFKFKKSRFQSIRALIDSILLGLYYSEILWIIPEKSKIDIGDKKVDIENEKVDIESWGILDIAFFKVLFVY